MFKARPAILCTGGAGFIGSCFVHHWLKVRPSDVVVNLDLLTYAGSPQNLPGPNYVDRHIFVQGNICDRPLLDRLFREYEIDTVVHFAAESHVDRSISGPAVFIQTNLVGTFTLLEACCAYWMEERGWGSEDCRFHHISTDEVFGSLSDDGAPFTEKTRYAPKSPYSASKAGSDHLVRAYCHTYDLPVTISNSCNNYGPYQHPEKFIPTVILSCLAARPIPIYGDGRNVRDWLYVDDYCRAIEAVLLRGLVGETYNIGGNNEYRNIEIARLICQLMDERRKMHAPHERLISFVTDRKGHDWRYAIDATKITRELGWKSEETFESGLAKTLDWYITRAPKP